MLCYCIDWSFLTSEIMRILRGFRVFSWEAPTVSYLPRKAELLLLCFRPFFFSLCFWTHWIHWPQRAKWENVSFFSWLEFPWPNVCSGNTKGWKDTVFLKQDFTLSKEWNRANLCTGVSFAIWEGRLIYQHCGSRKVLLERWRASISWTQVSTSEQLQCVVCGLWSPPYWHALVGLGCTQMLFK